MFRTTFGAIGTTLIALAMSTNAPAAEAQTVTYEVTFEATWTSATHPVDFPPSPHFSGLVGGTHNNSVSFWQEGELASLGMKHMAEWGDPTDLLTEVQTAIGASQAESTISDTPLWTVPGSTSVSVDLTAEFPLVTLVAMIAPSPDWFVGVRNLDLMDGGQWADEIVVDLYPWDSGTDSGASYTSGDQVTSPPEPIFAITEGPFSPGVPLGTFTFTREIVSTVPQSPGVQATAYPNPFNPQTTISWELPGNGPMTLEIFDVRGRSVRVLHDQETAAGPGQMVWNGRDDSGRMVNSGQYFYAIRTGDYLLTRKLTLVK
jgi:Spondin_N/FlgD Ig-like domain